MPRSAFRFPIPNCPTCHLNHEDIEFHPYMHPSEDGTHYVICPTNSTIITCIVRGDEITFRYTNAKHPSR